MNLPKFKDVFRELIKIGKEKGIIRDDIDIEPFFTDKESDYALDFKVFLMFKEMYIENKKKEPKRVKCKFCQKEFKAKRYLEDHIDKVHCEFRLSKCEHCSKTYRHGICK